MDMSAIGAWAGDHGPYLAIIAFLCRIIHVLLSRFLAQQDQVLRLIHAAERSVDTTAHVVDKVATDK